MKLYENIKNLRIQKGYSQQKLAQLVGYKDRSIISRIESGLVDLNQKKIDKFAKVLGVSPLELMGFENRAEIESEIRLIFDQLSDEQKDAVLHFLRTMIDTE